MKDRVKKESICPQLSYPSLFGVPQTLSFGNSFHRQWCCGPVNHVSMSIQSQSMAHKASEANLDSSPKPSKF